MEIPQTARVKREKRRAQGQQRPRRPPRPRRAREAGRGAARAVRPPKGPRSGEQGARAAPKAALRGWGGKRKMQLPGQEGEGGPPRCPPNSSGRPLPAGTPRTHPPARCRPAWTSLLRRLRGCGEAARPQHPRTLSERPPLGAPLSASGSRSRRLAQQPRGLALFPPPCTPAPRPPPLLLYLHSPPAAIFLAAQL